MLKQMGDYVWQNHEHGKLQHFTGTNVVAEMEHETKDPHCTELVCEEARLCFVVQVNTLEQNECEVLLRQSSSAHKHAPLPPHELERSH